MEIQLVAIDSTPMPGEYSVVIRVGSQQSRFTVPVQALREANDTFIVEGNSDLFRLLGGDFVLYTPILKAVGAQHRGVALTFPIRVGEIIDETQ